MKRQARFRKSSGSTNNNKFYYMTENDDGTFTAHYGRIGAKGAKKIKPMREWDRTQSTRLGNGYLEVTELEAVQDKKPTAEADPKLDDILKFLNESSSLHVDSNFDLSEVGQVTDQLIDEAKKYINAYADMIARRDIDMWALNKQLDLIRTIIPRKIVDLRELQVTDLTEARARYDEELDLIEALGAQIVVTTSQGRTISESLGIEFDHKNDMIPTIFEDDPYIKDHSGCKKGMVKNLWLATHGTTEDRYQSYKKNDPNAVERIYMHGSVNRNWMSIMNTGLLVRPSGVGTNGNMFGDGIYFASNPMKSLGYSDLNGVGRWASGDEIKGFVALVRVNVGRQLHLKNQGDENQIGSCGDIELKKLSAKEYDSTYVHSGYVTRVGEEIYNEEFIIYDPARATLAGLVEVGPA